MSASVAKMSPPRKRSRKHEAQPLATIATIFVALLATAAGLFYRWHNSTGGANQQQHNPAATQGLVAAVSQGNAQLVSSLLGSGASADATMPAGGWPVLTFAAQLGNSDITEALIKHGAMVDAAHNGWTALLLAVGGGHIGVVNSLLAHGASTSITSPDGSTALHLAADFGGGDVARALLRSGANAEAAKTRDGNQPLHRASELGHVDVATALLEAGAAVDAPAAGGWRPLLLAIARAHTQLAISLLEHGASPHHARDDGLLPLHLAMRNEVVSQPLVEALLSRGAQIDAATRSGETALHAAVATNKAELIRLLLARGAAVDVHTADYRKTPLHVAASMGAAEIVATLLEHGASAGATDLLGHTAAYIANYHGHLEVSRLLQSSSAGNNTSGAGTCLAKAFARGGVTTLADLSVVLPPVVAAADDAALRDAADRARVVWERQGVVVFPRLLPSDVVATLRHGVEAELRRDAQETVDRTYSIRQASARTLRAVDVAAVSADALRVLASRLGRFLSAALLLSSSDGDIALLESSVMHTQVGAAEQSFHSDAALCDPRLVSVQIALVDTAISQGALEVLPGSQPSDKASSTAAEESSTVVVGVPEGTVTFYAPSLVHRGRGNQHTRDRLFLGLTLLGDGGIVPSGIPYTLQPHDLRRWCIAIEDEGATASAGECRKSESDTHDVDTAVRV